MQGSRNTKLNNKIIIMTCYQYFALAYRYNRKDISSHCGCFSYSLDCATVCLGPMIGFLEFWKNINGNFS